MASAFSHTLVDRLAQAESVAVLTGAGISAESGIPTFRDPGGLWQKFRPEELANVEAFLANPVLVQGWYQHRQQVALEKAPNAGHDALVAMETLVAHFTLITQNVDNLHQRAGSQNVVELHGNIMRSYCVECGRFASEAALRPASQEITAQCANCAGLLRPDVVWFGEWLPPDALEAAEKAAQQADVFLSIGTSAVVYPAAGLPQVAKKAGAYVAEINIAPSAIAASMHEVVQGKSGEILPILIEAVRRKKINGAL